MVKEKFNYFIKVKCGNQFLYVKNIVDIITFTNDINEAYKINNLTYERVNNLCDYLLYKRYMKVYCVKELVI